MEGYFSQDLFKFLKALKKNNNREWFQKNKERYEEFAKEPMLEFITEIKPSMIKISSRLKVDPKPVGGSMFRIYRDVRFGADKSPYKTHMGAHFPIRAGDGVGSKGVHAPGFYFHVEPNHCFVGAGIWHPDGAALTRIRQKIVADPKGWKKIVNELSLEGESLKNPPRGFDPLHPFVEDLKRKDFISSLAFSDADICQKNFDKVFVKTCSNLSPLVSFLSEALSLSY